MEKPLGHKAYGHIPHFDGSRMGPSDKKCSPGHQKIMTEKARDYKDLIIVQEKLDGSNCSIAKINDEIISLTRSGYRADTSPYDQHHYFAFWVTKNRGLFSELLLNGERIAGEWMLQACGTKYDLSGYEHPFIPFDIMVGHERKTYHDFLLRVLPFDFFVIPRLIHLGQPLKLKHAIKEIQISGHSAIDQVEGFVYRCEREGRVDFICKYVRPDKEDGIYLPERSGKKPVWNFDPENL